jgi:hypothetical protein
MIFAAWGANTDKKYLKAYDFDAIPLYTPY